MDCMHKYWRSLSRCNLRKDIAKSPNPHTKKPSQPKEKLTQEGLDGNLLESCKILLVLSAPASPCHQIH